ncbi:MAG: hypothetical protein EOP38_30765 [Rubrivivax sp.]|nr:MAG: hypothetical protein EOP38_30765 [Rubrivivax sp.]
MPSTLHPASRLCTAWSLALAASAASAGDWQGAVGLASDKVIRGLTQSQGEATLLLDLNYRADTAWMATLGFATLQRHGHEGRSNEFSAGLAKAWQLDDDWLAQTGYAHYQYSGEAPAYIRHYDEVTASLGWQGRVAGTLTLSPNTYSWYRSGQPRPGPALATELSLNQRVMGRLALQAGAGYYQLMDAGNWGYGYASVGLSWGLGPVQTYLSYISSQAAKRGLVPASFAGERCVGTVLWGF